MNLQQQEQFYQMMTRLKSSRSKAAAAPVIKPPCDMIVSDNPDRINSNNNNNSRSASTSAATQYEAVVKEKKYDMSLPSGGDQVYKCGAHDYETRSLKEFNQHVEDHGSKAASVSGINNNKIKAINDFIKGKY
jgi:hypothetical protein